MVVERKISVHLYVAALIITIVIFAIGVYVGKAMDNFNIGSINNDINQAYSRVSSIEILFLADDPVMFCPVYAEELISIDAEREKIGNKLDYLEREKNVSDQNLKVDYSRLQATSYLIAKKINEKCAEDKILVLYFYSNTNCEKCEQQGIELTEARKIATSNGSTKINVYALDGEFKSAIVDAFKKKYNVSSYPTIVIENKTYTGFIEKDMLVKELAK